MLLFQDDLPMNIYLTFFVLLFQEELQLTNEHLLNVRMFLLQDNLQKIFSLPLLVLKMIYK